MRIVFSSRAWEDYRYWVETDRKTLLRLNRLIEECRRTPHTGIGKPEPLKGDLSGWWSRRIDDTHRLVYRVSPEGLLILQCRYHY